jgi:hypothetical protein
MYSFPLILIATCCVMEKPLSNHLNFVQWLLDLVDRLPCKGLFGVKHVVVD